MADRKNFVLIFKGEKDSEAAAISKVEAVPDLVVLNRGLGSLRVEGASTPDFPGRVQATGNWLVSEEHIYHLC
ncbi:hypothetical protein AB4Y45_33085 [Paraburkholderia sp. EG287A]|uniref:hypothetical protein n=1 Tax=Paraburkholderia sp. EG287A TaxID=3237012 RepID=UPI0034D21EF3